MKINAKGNRLTSASILRQADETKPYIIKSDASFYTIGAVLVQEQGEHEHPVEFASRLMTSAERNYSTTEREALAVVWAVTKIRGYIEGLPVNYNNRSSSLEVAYVIIHYMGGAWSLRYAPIAI